MYVSVGDKHCIMETEILYLYAAVEEEAKTSLAVQLQLCIYARGVYVVREKVLMIS